MPFSVGRVTSVAAVEAAIEREAKDLVVVGQRSSAVEALRTMHTHVAHELEVLELRSKIASEAQSEMTREQREYVLRQQLRAIQEELGGKGDQGDIGSLREKLAKAELPEDIRKDVE